MITITTGVKQGDPSAMQLFILAYDPLIRFIDRALSPIEHALFGYCDDLAVAASKLYAAWSLVVRCVVVITRISSLALNNDKTQFLCTSFITRVKMSLIFGLWSSN